MIEHLDRELFHNKLLHKTLGFPLSIGPGSQPRTRCKGPVILPKLCPINFEYCTQLQQYLYY